MYIFWNLYSLLGIARYFKLSKWIFRKKLELNFRQDPLTRIHERWLECILLPLMMNVVYFPCSISFLNEWDIQVGSWPKQELNGTKKSENSLVPYWTWYANGWVYFDERMCLFRMVVPVPTEWLWMFRDNPFRPNECVCLTNKYVYLEWFRLFQLNRCVFSEW